MKKFLKISFIYCIIALVGGVIFREVTKLSGFNGITALSRVHVHTMILGMFIFLILALFASIYDIDKNKYYKKFIIIYNVSLSLIIIMFFIRGLCDIYIKDLSKIYDSSISGISGLAHIMITIGFIYMYKMLMSNNKKVLK